MGLRLPLSSLGAGPEPRPAEPAVEPPDPRRSEELAERARRDAAPGAAPPATIRTALCVEIRDGELVVFLPPVATAEDCVILVTAVDAARRNAVVVSGEEADFRAAGATPRSPTGRRSSAGSPGRRRTSPRSTTRSARSARTPARSGRW